MFVDASGSSECGPVGDGSDPCRPGTAAPPICLRATAHQGDPRFKGPRSQPAEDLGLGMSPHLALAGPRPGGTDDRGGRTPARLRAGGAGRRRRPAPRPQRWRGRSYGRPRPFIRGIANRPAPAGSASPPNHHIQGKRGGSAIKLPSTFVARVPTGPHPPDSCAPETGVKWKGGFHVGALDASSVSP